MIYRKEVDGLRAIAILAVIVFHIDESFLSGGFLGVDIFFVISGYLISSLILDQLAANKFSILNFYEKRVRRIFPPLLAMLLVMSLIFWIYLDPSSLDEYASSIKSILLLFSNIYFYNTGGYFDNISNLKPTLHTWSLSVEEQFYVLFPIIAVVLYKFYSLRTIKLILIFLITTSFIISITYVSRNPTSTFFLLPFRIWEICIGCLIPFLNITNLRNNFKFAPPYLGLLLIFLSLINAKSNYSISTLLYSLILVFGTTLIIAYSNLNSFPNKILSSDFLVNIGIISYGLYLWHHPIFVLIKITNSYSFFSITISIIFIFILSYISYKFIEKPARNINIINRQLFLKISFSCFLFLIFFAFFNNYNHGFKHLLSYNERKILSFKKYDYQTSLRQNLCFLISPDRANSFKTYCDGLNSGDTYLLWGDSYAASSYFGLESLHNDIAQFTASSCPPFISYKNSKNINCNEINSFVMNKIKKIQPSKVILQANWTMYSSNDLSTYLHLTIKQIKLSSPLTQIYIIGPLPQWNKSLPEIIFTNNYGLQEEKYHNPVDFKKLITIDYELYDLLNSRSVKYISPLKYLCNYDKCLVTTIYSNDKLIYPMSWDTGHLTIYGSKKLFDKLKNEFK